MTNPYTFQNFSKYLNTTFQIHYSTESPLDVELIEIKKLGGDTTNPDRKPFSLVFYSVDRENYLIQQIYTFEHPQMGSLDIFIVPLGPDDHGMRYEAIFT
ncbi:DUF6916 family protein [Chloroflexota bacterium]